MPVEMWRDIFHLCLGLAQVDTQGWLLAYDFLRVETTQITRAYQIKEQIRAKLSLVCRLWRDILAEMDDGIVVSGPDGPVWPPNRSIEQAKHVIYSDNFSYYLMRLGKQPWAFGGTRTRFTVTVDQLNGAIVQLEGVEIATADLSPFPHAPTVNIKALYLPNMENSVQVLLHPRFQHLVALNFHARYPFNVSDPLSLPSLRCLVLKLWTNYKADLRGTFSNWTFPNLSAFELNPGAAYTERMRADVEGFLLVHAETLEEVVFKDGFQVSDAFDVHRSLGRLRMYTIHPRLEIYRGYGGILAAVEDWPPPDSY